MNKGIFIVVLILALTGCTDKKSSPRLKNISKQEVKSRSLQAGGIRIYPEDPTVDAIITLSTDGAFAEGATITWYVNDIKDESSSGLHFKPASLKKGDTVKAVVMKNGKEYASNELIINNTPPSILIYELLPAEPKADSTFTVRVTAKDIDDDMINYKYAWSVNDVFVSEQPYLNTDLKPGDKVAVEITPYDKDASGKTVRMTKKVMNSLPEYSESKPVFDGATYTYQVKATDPDNDPLTFTLQKGPEGMKIDPASGLITWNVAPKDKGYHEIEVRVDDKNGGALIIPFTTKIGFE